MNIIKLLQTSCASLVACMHGHQSEIWRSSRRPIARLCQPHVFAQGFAVARSVMRVSLLAIATLSCFLAASEKVWVESNGYVVMECENTDSPLDQWIVQQSIDGFTGASHLMFDGNSTGIVPATSPLTYKFKITTSGTYKLMMRAGKTAPEGTPSDHSNDCYMRMEGNYTSATDLELNKLKVNQKF
ncbi:MAG: hypothetical protein HRU15_12640, partial [Planctomycetes bacterium]|nr:hypothetical protein [Planctomycetota bacterium]